jgi:hypothetical protein
MADDLFSEVLTNLIGNSLKFGGPGTSIWINTKDQGDFIELSIEDTGPGIADSLKPVIFERFSRGDTKKPGRAWASISSRVLSTVTVVQSMLKIEYPGIHLRALQSGSPWQKQPREFRGNFFSFFLRFVGLLSTSAALGWPGWGLSTKKSILSSLWRRMDILTGTWTPWQYRPMSVPGRGPTGTAYREKIFNARNDVANYPKIASLRYAVLERGYRPVAAFPFALLTKTPVLLRFMPPPWCFSPYIHRR